MFFLRGFVLLVEVEPVPDGDFGAEVVSEGEFLEVLADRLGVYAVHFQHAGRGRRAVLGDRLQGMGRRYASRVACRGEEFAGEHPVEFLGRAGFGLPKVGHLAFDAQPYLVEFPVLQPCGKKLVGERPLLAEEFEREEILERMRHSRLGGVECRPGDDALQRL